VSYSVRIKQSAERALGRVPKADRSRIDQRIVKLAENPRLPGVVPLTGAGKGLWRIRIGHWRVVYQIDDSNQAVLVVTIAHRREVYRGL